MMDVDRLTENEKNHSNDELPRIVIDQQPRCSVCLKNHDLDEFCS